MQGVFSTRDVEPRNRAAYWNDLVCDAFVHLDCRYPKAPTYNGTMRCSALSWLRLIEGESDCVEAIRSRRHIAKGQEDSLLVAIQVRGRTGITQDGHETLLAPGDMTLCDSQRPYTVQISDGNEALWLHFPRQEFLARLASTRPFVARPVSGHIGTSALFVEHARLLSKRSREFHGNDAPAIADHALDLLALALSRDAANPVALSSSKRIALQRLKRTIQAHLRDCDLNPSKAAALAGINVRHANRLLALEETSLERFIFSERLTRCHAALRNGASEGLTISEIAFAWGFNDLGHFSRSFRARFGMSPREFRKTAQ
jgi:AraC-like DNA-binding protein